MTISRRTLMKDGLKLSTASLLTAGALGAVTSVNAQAAASKKKTSQAGFITRKLGDFEVTALLDGFLPVNENQLIGYDAAKAKPVRQEAFAGEKGPIQIPVSAYLINTGKKLILIDAGTATAFGPTLGHLDKSIEAAGYKPEQVDTILITHQHPDHVFGLIDAKGNKVFPNAELVIGEKEYKFWHDDANIVKETENFIQLGRKSVLPYKKETRLIQPGKEVTPGITAAALPGHTPGQLGYIISSANQSLFFVADLLHITALQFAFPEWNIVFDADKNLAAETRRKTLDQIATDKLFIAGSHLSFPGFGHVARNGKAFRFVPAEWQYS